MENYQLVNSVATISFNEYTNSYRDVDKFIAFCKQCNKYGACWVCPPYDFNMDTYMSGFERVYIIGTKIIPSPDVTKELNSSEEIHEAGRQILAEVRRIIDPQLLEIEKHYQGSKAFFAGTCFQCPVGECTRTIGKPCIYPEKVRPSLEAFGFDIGKTASELLRIDLKWSKDGNMPEYFTLVSGIFTNHQIEFSL